MRWNMRARPKRSDGQQSWRLTQSSRLTQRKYVAARSSVALPGGFRWLSAKVLHPHGQRILNGSSAALATSNGKQQQSMHVQHPWNPQRHEKAPAMRATSGIKTRRYHHLNLDPGFSGSSGGRFGGGEGGSMADGDGGGEDGGNLGSQSAVHPVSGVPSLLQLVATPHLSAVVAQSAHPESHDLSQDRTPRVHEASHPEAAVCTIRVALNGSAAV